MVEWVTSKRMHEVEDGKIEVIGPEITDIPAKSLLPMAIIAAPKARLSPKRACARRSFSWMPQRPARRFRLKPPFP